MNSLFSVNPNWYASSQIGYQFGLSAEKATLTNTENRALSKEISLAEWKELVDNGSLTLEKLGIKPAAGSNNSGGGLGGGGAAALILAPVVIGGAILAYRSLHRAGAAAGTAQTAVQRTADITNAERKYMDVYDYQYYRSHNADLVETLGDNRGDYLRHFLEFGMKEGRVGWVDFDVRAYKERYPDLVRMYGNDNRSYYLHYLKTGKAEGRIGSAALVTKR